MTISHVQGAGENGGTSASFASAVASGDTVCLVFGYYTGTFTSITDDKGNTYTVPATSGSGLSAGYTLGVAYLTNITNAPRTITINGSALNSPSLIIDEFSGASEFDADNYTTTTTNSASLPSGNITAAQNGELLYAAGGAYSSGSVSIGSPWTSLETAGSYANILSAWQAQGTAGLVGASFTPSNGNDRGFAAILAFKPAAQEIGLGPSGEWLGRVAAAAEPLEAVVRGQRIDASAACETLGLQREDAVFWADALSTAALDEVVQVEWQGDLSLVAEAFCLLETVGRQLADVAFLLESNSAATTPVVSDRDVTLEILGGGVCNTRSIFEQLQSARAGIGAATGMLMAVAVRPGLPSEAVGQAVTLSEAVLAIETGSRCPADAAIASETALPVRADDTAVTELWITPLPQIAPGRLLTSPGRRRLLTGGILE